MATMTTPLPPDPYRVLGVDSDADANAIKKAYRKLVLSCHPDKVTDEKLKAQKQEEFHQIQQAYEIVGDPDNRTKYESELKAKMREDRDRATPKGSPTHARHVNVNIFTARPPPEFRSKHSPPKPTAKPYSSDRGFSRSWEHAIPTRSRAYEEEGRKTRRTMSDEKLKRDRDESKERDRAARRRAEEERARRQRDEEIDRLMRKREREQRAKDATRMREAEKRERKERDEREARAKAERRAERAAERDRADRADRERERQRRDLEEKLKSKAKPYVEPDSGDEEDVRTSRSKNPSKKDSTPRDKSASKLRERSSPREEVVPELPNSDDKLQSNMAFAAQYIKKSLPKFAADVQFSSTEYPDPSKWAPKRRTSAEAKMPKAEAAHVDSPPSPTVHMPPRLQKSYTMGHVPTTTEATPPPMRVPLGRSYTMEPEYLSRATAGGADKQHRSSRGRTSLDDDDYHFSRPRVQKYKVGTDKGTPRVVESEYKDPYPRGPSAAFAKVKTSQPYGLDDVSASRSYGRDELLTSEYGQPSYSQYKSAAYA